MKTQVLKKNLVSILFGVLIFCSITFFSNAQEYPNKPVNILIAANPGGTGDLTVRPLAIKAEKFLGGSFAISNNGGGGGAVGVSLVAKERPDGYHLVGTMATHLVLFPQVRSTPYKSDDLIPIAQYGAPVAAISVKADAPYKSLKELVAYAKKNPGKVQYSIPGVDTPNHLIMEYIGRKEGIEWTAIPFQGGSPAFTAMMGGHVNVTSGMATSWMPHVKEGTVLVLATFGKKRAQTLPNVPTLSELGYNIVYEDQCIIAAPKGVPHQIIKKLEEIFKKGAEDPEFLAVMSKMGMQVSYEGSEETKKYLKETQDLFSKMIQEIKGVKVEKK